MPSGGSKAGKKQKRHQARERDYNRPKWDEASVPMQAYLSQDATEEPFTGIPHAGKVRPPRTHAGHVDPYAMLGDLDNLATGGGSSNGYPAGPPQYAPSRRQYQQPYPQHQYQPSQAHYPPQESYYRTEQEPSRGHNTPYSANTNAWSSGSQPYGSMGMPEYQHIGTHNGRKLNAGGVPYGGVYDPNTSSPMFNNHMSQRPEDEPFSGLLQGQTHKAPKVKARKGKTRL